MAKASKTIKRVLLALLAIALVVPFLIPVESSGTKSYQEAAGPNATFIEISGYEVYYQETKGYCDPQKTLCVPGQEPVFILLHGFGSNVYSFEALTPMLSQYGDVVAYDRPAFGFTERPVSWVGSNPYSSEGQLELLDGMVSAFSDARDVILVGHSAGGTIAAQYALDYPGKVSSLILVSPAIGPSNGGLPSWLNWIFYIPQLDRLGPLLVSRIAETGNETIYQSWYDKEKVTQAVLDGYRKPLEIEGWEKAFWEFNRAPRTFDAFERLEELSIPVVLITGDTDTIVPTNQTEKLATLIPNTKLFVIPEVGHIAHEEKPTETMRAIDESWVFLSQ
jgi:pimeloyl-ACP methyl ester carboxylesterase